MHVECHLHHNSGLGIGAQGKSRGPVEWTGGRVVPHQALGISCVQSVRGSVILRGRVGVHWGVWVTVVCTQQLSCTGGSSSGGSSEFYLWARGGWMGRGSEEGVFAPPKKGF